MKFYGKEKEHNELKSLINEIIPYVIATLSEQNTLFSDQPDWGKVHLGRMKSSVAQLNRLLKEANKEN